MFKLKKKIFYICDNIKQDKTNQLACRWCLICCYEELVTRDQCLLQVPKNGLWRFHFASVAVLLTINADKINVVSPAA